MRFHRTRAFDCAANGRNLFIGSNSWSAGHGNDGANARSIDDLQLSIGGVLHEKISREEWQQETLFSVLPPVHRPVRWQEGLETLQCEYARDGLLVLVASLQGVPTFFQVNTLRSLNAHKASPFDSQNREPCLNFVSLAAWTSLAQLPKPRTDLQPEAGLTFPHSPSKSALAQLLVNLAENASKVLMANPAPKALSCLRSMRTTQPPNA